MWIHINFYFFKTNAYHRKNKYLNPAQKLEFEKYLRKLLLVNAIAIKRKYFLYEPDPHCFLAVEVKKGYVGKLITKCWEKRKPKFIKKITYKTDTADIGNGNVYLNCMDNLTDVTLSLFKNYPYWLDKFKLKDLKQHAHIIHCWLNQATASRPLEREFYKEMLKRYKCR